MGKYTKPKSASEKDDKKEEELYVKFEVPLNVTDPNTDKYERKEKVFNDGYPFDWCEFRETTDELFEAFGCAGPTTYMANKRYHLYIALFAGRAKECYIVNYNTINAVDNQKAIDDQESDAVGLRKVINETANRSFIPGTRQSGNNNST
jgi:hypothetical protein